MNLLNKKILFLSAQVFGYQYEIKACMERQGAQVDYFDERPANTFLVKAMIRINRNLLSQYIDRYHGAIIDRTRKQAYDYIFFIKGESISASNLGKLKAMHPQAQLIIYHWDSIANNRNALRILPLFDRVFSFDKSDCEKLGIRFLPLFYLSDYAKIAESVAPVKYHLLFIGTTHSDRYQLVKTIEQQAGKRSDENLIYFFFPNKILYYKMKLQNKYLRDTSAKDFHFEPLDKERVLGFFRVSKVMVDIQHPRQTGLTMRCIETLGAKRKLITTNCHIKEYDFYRDQNILVVDRSNPVIPDEFFDTPYLEIPDSVYQKYSLTHWIETIFQG